MKSTHMSTCIICIIHLYINWYFLKTWYSWCMNMVFLWALASSFLRGSCTGWKDFGRRKKSNTNKIVKKYNQSNSQARVCISTSIYVCVCVCVCACGRILWRRKSLRAHVYYFYIFSLRNMARRCTVFILCFCARLMCRDMRSYRTRSDNRAGASGWPRVPVPPPQTTVPHTPPRLVFPRAGMTEPPSVVWVRLYVCVSTMFTSVSIQTHIPNVYLYLRCMY